MAGCSVDFKVRRRRGLCCPGRAKLGPKHASRPRFRATWTSPAGYLCAKVVRASRKDESENARTLPEHLLQSQRLGYTSALKPMWLCMMRALELRSPWCQEKELKKDIQKQDEPESRRPEEARRPHGPTERSSRPLRSRPLHTRARFMMI